MLNFWGINLHVYGLVLGFAILLAREVAIRVAVERKLDVDLLDKVFITSLIGGIVGARFYHVLDNFSYYSENVVKIFFVWEGGLGIWGGILGGLVALQLSAISFQRSGIKRGEVLDIAAIGLPLGQAIGRWGNFFNGEIVGKNGEPIFLFESLATFILFLIIYRLRNRKRGKLLGIYLLGYGIIRLVLEGFRNQSDAWIIGDISVSKVLSIISIFIGVWIATPDKESGSR